jgi:hypothetical protein
LPKTIRRTCAKSFKKVDRIDCEIRTFEVEINLFFACAQQGQQTLTTRGAKFLNYATLSFCTIVMHIMLGTCVLNYYFLKFENSEISNLHEEWNI